MPKSYASIQELEVKALEEAKLCRRVFATPDGAEVLALLERVCADGWLPISPAQGAPIDPNRAVFNEGARAIPRWIRDMLAKLERMERNGG